MHSDPGFAFSAIPVVDSTVANTGRSSELPEAEYFLWRRFRELGDQRARAALLALHLPYARVVAASYHSKRRNDEIEFCDYWQLASLGLIESIDRFDPAVGVLFKTFAARRMHGSILNGIEQLTEKQQQIAARQRLAAQQRFAIKSTGYRNDEAGLPKLRDSEQVRHFTSEVGLAFALAWTLEGTGMFQSTEAYETLPFYRSVELEQIRQHILDLVNSLPEQEKRVIRSHYFQEVAFVEIATSMQLTRGRISQIHKQGLTRLAEILRERRYSHAPC